MRDTRYIIRDADGIHARPAGILVKKMQEFASDIVVKNGDKVADGKKLFQVMKLGVKCGDTITVSANGADEGAAMTAMQTILKENL